MSKRGPKRKSVQDRLLAKVEVDPVTGCWNWTAATNAAGYGVLALGGKYGGSGLAHRVAYQLFNGPIPDAHLVCHACDNPSCVNPDHLFTGTHQANMDDMVAKTRHAHGATSYAKLTIEQVRAIKTDTRSQSAIAADYGLSQQHVSDLKLGKRWRHFNPH